jgi:hypothetical protein
MVLAMTVGAYGYYHQKLADMVGRGELDVSVLELFVSLYDLFDYREMLGGNSDYCLCCYVGRYPNLPELGLVYIMKPLAGRVVVDFDLLFGAMGVRLVSNINFFA